MLNLTLTDSLDAYGKIVSAVGIGTCKTRTTAIALTSYAIDVYNVRSVA